MPKTTYTCPEVPGAKRTSDRPYSHAIVGRYSPALAAIQAEAYRAANKHQQNRWDIKHWNDEKRLSECPSGGTYVNHNNHRTTASDDLIKIGTNFIAQFPTVEVYLESLEAAHREWIAKLRAGKDGEIALLQWSMSFANAHKAQGTWCKNHSDVRVVETAVLEKPARKVKAAKAEA